LSFISYKGININPIVNGKIRFSPLPKKDSTIAVIIAIVNALKKFKKTSENAKVEIKQAKDPSTLFLLL
jgi:hypothetical protein